MRVPILLHANLPKAIIWLIPVFLWILQSVYTFSSMNNLRPDEIYTVADILPFQNRALSGPGASSVAFYAPIMILYNIFGFDIYMPKFYRLAIQLISLLCLAALLKKYFGQKRAILPLITFGLSPMLLYWTTMEAGWGIDLQFFPICLFLVDTLSLKRKWTYITGPILGGIVIMLSWMSYATFMFYLPFLFWFQLKKLSQFRLKEKLSLSVTFIVSFLLPVLGIYLYILERGNLFYDPEVGRGLFTGGGAIIFDESQFIRSTAAIFVNLFDKATSYVFELRAVEFSHILPLLTFIFILIIPLKNLGKDKELKKLTFWCLATAIFNVILTGLMLDGSGMPGGRRNTPFLVSIYGLFAITYYLIFIKNVSLQISKTSSGVIFTIFLIHHLVVYPVNLAGLSAPNSKIINSWFNSQDSPQVSVNKLLRELQQHDLMLDCEKQLGVSYPFCQYGSIYAILTEACLYNKLDCYSVKARFPFESEYKTLSYELFAKEGWDK